MYENLRAVMIIVALIATAFFTITYVYGAINTILYSSWVVRIAEKQFAATVGLPFAALAAFCIVTILEASYGPIEIEGFGIKFKGAAGPAIIWIFTFLSITSSIKLVWIKGNSVAEDQESGKKA
jgi:hypothetical protein